MIDGLKVLIVQALGKTSWYPSPEELTDSSTVRFRVAFELH